MEETPIEFIVIFEIHIEAKKNMHKKPRYPNSNFCIIFNTYSSKVFYYETMHH